MLLRVILVFLLNLLAVFKAKDLHESLDRRISTLESLKQTEASQHVEATE